MPNPSAFRMFLAATGAIRPPALLECGFPELDLESGGFPHDTEAVELECEDGSVLRGTYVPADPGAPLVLHLLESEGSVTFGARNLFGYRMLQELQDFGFASLMVDYRGIGASSGKRDPGNIPADAKLAWEEALRRVDGEQRRIVVRGMSFGCLATASLLDQGADPAGVILVAPPRAETVIQNWLRKYYPKMVAKLASFARMPLQVDIVQVLSELDRPLLVYAPMDDYVLPEDERLMMQEAVAKAGGVWVPSPLTHASCVLDAHHLFSHEARFLRRLFGDLGQEEKRVQSAIEAMPESVARLFVPGSRLHAHLRSIAHERLPRPPALAGALALAANRGAQLAPLIYWLRQLPLSTLDALPFEGLVALTDLEDPAGRIDARNVVELAEYLLELPGEFPRDDFVALAQLGREFGFDRSIAPHGSPGRWRNLSHGEHARALYRRRMRALFKAAGIPERYRLDGELEVWTGDGWQIFGAAALAQLPRRRTA